jgi:glycosyltransferase involved in cell wall biosynthesis
MKILSITAGAAGMYCGSCFRDNAVAAELIRRGHDVTLLPVYTPTRTDEANVSDQRQVLFGGINVYLQQRSAIFRHLPRFVDRLVDSPTLIRSLSQRSAATDPALLGGLTISMLEGTGGLLRREFEKLVAWMTREPLPDVINLPNSLLIAMAAPLRSVTKRPVCCTLQGEELFLQGLEASYRTEALRLIAEQVRTVDQFIAVSHHERAFMAEYLKIPRERISVVPLGISFDGYRPRTRSIGRPKRVGYFARIAPEKGLHRLADAFIAVGGRQGLEGARLEVAGYLSASDRGYLEGVRRKLADAGLADRFTYHGEVDRAGKLEFLESLDVLSVPATYDEPKGLFLLEAMAAGVPVVQPRRGAFTEIVERTGGGLLVPADDSAALGHGLERVLLDESLAVDLSQRAYAGVRQHYSIGQSAEALLSVYDEVIAGQPASLLP